MSLHRILIALSLGCGAALAQAAAPLLVDADWLSAHLHDKNMVVLHAGPAQDYEASHIPGARRLSAGDLSKPANHDNPKDLSLELPAMEELRSKLAAAGISDDSRIVVTYSRPEMFPGATRVVLTLVYAGLGDRVSILNGGLPAWTGAGKPVSTAAADVTPGKLSARPPKSVVVDADFVKSLNSRSHYKLVDARAPVYFNGTEDTYRKSGHIPGAVNIPFTEILDNTGRVDKAKVAALFEKAGIGNGDTVVAYCHIGLQATAVIFGARLVGHPAVLYDGAFQDWAINERGPVEK